jgi:hypothetical protein
MCLINAKKIKKHEVVKAWKVFAVRTYSDREEITSPYIHTFEWKVGEMMVPKEEIYIGKTTNNINEGAFHSFKFYENAENEIRQNTFLKILHKKTFRNNYSEFYTLAFRIGEVEIPEDADLYEGKYGFASAYASTKMKLIKIVDDDYVFNESKKG